VIVLGQAFICDVCGDVYSGMPWTRTHITEHEESLDTHITMSVEVEIRYSSDHTRKVTLCNRCFKKIVFGRVIKEMDMLSKNVYKIGNISEGRPVDDSESIK